MLDIKLIRNEPEGIRAQLRRRGGRAEAVLDTLLSLDERRRALIVQVEEKRSLRNAVSEEIAAAKKTGTDASDQIAAMRDVGDEIKTLEAGLKAVEDELERELLQVPNLADPSAPDGGEEDSVVLHTWGAPRAFAFAPRDHLDLGTALDMIDMERGGKVRGAGSPISRAISCSSSSRSSSSRCRSWWAKASGRWCRRCWCATRPCTARASSPPTCNKCTESRPTH